MRIVSIFILVILSTQSACRRCTTSICPSTGDLNVHLIHYSEPEATPVILRTYRKGSNYTDLLYTGYVNLRQFSGDTMHLYSLDLQADSMYAIHYDLELFIPSDGKTIRLFEIVRNNETQTHCSSWPFFEKAELNCWNTIQSFQYQVNTGSISSSGNEVFVLK